MLFYSRILYISVVNFSFLGDLSSLGSGQEVSVALRSLVCFYLVYFVSPCVHTMIALVAPIVFEIIS